MFDGIDFGGMFDGLRDGLLTGLSSLPGTIVDAITGWAVHAGPWLFVQGVLIMLGGLVTYLLGGSTQALGAVSWLTRTPADVTYNLAGMADLVNTSKAIGLALLVPGVALTGAGYTIGAIRDDAEDLSRRIVVGVVLTLTIDRLTTMVFDVHNGMAGGFSAGATLPGLPQAQLVEASLQGTAMAVGATVGGVMQPGTMTPAATQLLAAGSTTVAYAVFGLVAGGAALGRIGFLDAMHALGPIAVACWVMPAGQSIAKGWATAFATALFAQLIVDLLLRIMGQMVGSGAAGGDVWQLVAGIVAGLMAAGIYSTACGMGAISIFRAASVAVRVARTAAAVAA